MIWPVLVYGGMVVALVTMILVVSHFLGERHRAPGRDKPYESGIEPTGSARVRYGARYYLVGVFFILFDVEVAILLTWAVAFREVGWAGYVAATLFIVTLAVGLAYVWKLGGLDWYSPGRAVLRQAQDGGPAAQDGGLAAQDGGPAAQDGGLAAQDGGPLARNDRGGS